MIIGGTLFTHNCIQFDYCFQESLASLQGVCDDISVVDAESSDGTLEVLREIASKDNRIRITQTAWTPSPVGAWLAELGNVARSNLRTPYHVYLQADEVIHENSYPEIRKIADAQNLGWVDRLNFIFDSKTVAPPGVFCGHRIVRLGLQSIPVVGDCEGLQNFGAPLQDTSVQFFHYGFIRKTEALINKGIEMQMAYWGGYDPIFDRMRTEGNAPLEERHPRSITNPFIGTHPAVAHGWLKSHGYEI